MKCPVCGQEARSHIYYCARCAVYVHEKCWQRHIAQAHKKEEEVPHGTLSTRQRKTRQHWGANR